MHRISEVKASTLGAGNGLHDLRVLMVLFRPSLQNNSEGDRFVSHYTQPPIRRSVKYILKRRPSTT
jgi:hypothetical protein